MPKVATKHKTVVETPHGKWICFEARVDRDGKQPLVAVFHRSMIAPALLVVREWQIRQDSRR